MYFSYTLYFNLNMFVFTLQKPLIAYQKQNVIKAWLNEDDQI